MTTANMKKATQRGDSMMETATSITFIPDNGGLGLTLVTLVDMKVGTVLTGHVKICTDDDTEYLGGTMYVRRNGLHFEPD